MSPLGTDNAGYSSLLTERLKDATRGQMEMRGYVYNTADPDLLINFNGKLQQKTQVTQAPPAIGPYSIAAASMAAGPAMAGAIPSSSHRGHAEHRPGRRAPQAAGGKAWPWARCATPRWPHRSRAWKRPSPRCSRNIRSAPAWPRRRDRSPSLEESRMSTARPSRKRQAAPADTDSPRRTSKTASADADRPRRRELRRRAVLRHGRPGAAGRRRSGAYQAGVYQGLHEAGIRPNWVAGISIGSINAAIIAGSPEDERGAAARVLGDDLPADRFRRPALGRYAGRHVRGHSIRLSARRP